MAKAKKTKYVVVTSSDYNFFISQVQKHLEAGYELVGGVSAVIDTRNQHAVVYLQALTA